MGNDDQPELDQLRKEDIKRAQEKDPSISHVLNALHNGKQPTKQERRSSTQRGCQNSQGMEETDYR